jgi:hypothetical protein
VLDEFVIIVFADQWLQAAQLYRNSTIHLYISSGRSRVCADDRLLATSDWVAIHMPKVRRSLVNGSHVRSRTAIGSTEIESIALHDFFRLIVHKPYR